MNVFQITAKAVYALQFVVDVLMQRMSVFLSEQEQKRTTAIQILILRIINLKI